MPDADWTRIKSEYLRGGTSFKKLSNKYNVSFSTLRKMAAKEQWTMLRSKSCAKRDIKIAEQVANKEAKKANMIETIADKLLKHIAQDIDNGAIDLSKRGYRDITGALKDLQEIKGYKSEADMREQLARIKKLEKEAAIEEQQKEINVVISGDLMDYGN